MDIERLREFQTLAECLNYSKAAAELYITQPVLSRHIHDLENQLDVKLLSRDTHKVELTPEGRVFYNESKNVINAYKDAIKMVHEASEGSVGRITIGFLSAAVEPFLRDFVLKFRSQQSGILMDFEAMELDELLDAVRNKRIDVGFATHVAEDKILHIQEIFTDRLCAVVGKDHPLSAKREVTIDELSGLPLVMLDRENHLTTFKFNERIFERHSADYNVVRFVPNIDTGLFFASVNSGIFLLPEHLVHMVSEHTMSVLPISNEDTRIRLNLIFHKENINPIVPVFSDSFAEFAKENEGRAFH